MLTPTNFMKVSSPSPHVEGGQLLDTCLAARSSKELGCEIGGVAIVQGVIREMVGVYVLGVGQDHGRLLDALFLEHLGVPCPTPAASKGPRGFSSGTKSLLAPADLASSHVYQLLREK